MKWIVWLHFLSVVVVVLISADWIKSRPPPPGKGPKLDFSTMDSDAPNLSASLLTQGEPERESNPQPSGPEVDSNRCNTVFPCSSPPSASF